MKNIWSVLFIVLLITPGLYYTEAMKTGNLIVIIAFIAFHALFVWSVKYITSLIKNIGNSNPIE